MNDLVCYLSVAVKEECVAGFGCDPLLGRSVLIPVDRFIEKVNDLLLIQSGGGARLCVDPQGYHQAYTEQKAPPGPPLKKVAGRSNGNGRQREQYSLPCPGRVRDRNHPVEAHAPIESSQPA